MNSVSLHPFAEIAPAQSRDHAPSRDSAREAAREEEKFVVQPVEPVERIRKDVERNDIASRPENANPAPRPATDRTADPAPQAISAVSDSNTGQRTDAGQAAANPAPVQAHAQAQPSEVTPARVLATATLPPVVPVSTDAATAAARAQTVVNASTTTAAPTISQANASGTATPAAATNTTPTNIAQLVGAAPNAHTVNSGQGGNQIPVVPTGAHAESAATASSAAQSTLTTQQASALLAANTAAARTASAAPNSATPDVSDKGQARPRNAANAASAIAGATQSSATDTAATAGVSTTQPTPTTAATAQTQSQTQSPTNNLILAQVLASTTAENSVNSPSASLSNSVSGDTPGVTQNFSAEMRAAINAPTQAAAYTARAAVTAQPATEQIAMQISRAAEQGVDRLSVQLKPAELGKVRIDLEVGPDNRILAVISAERSETLDLLQRDARSLEKALNDAGVKTDSGSLEFNLQGDGGAAENGRDGDGKLSDGAIMLPGDTGTPDADGILTNTPLILPEGRIDIQV